MRCVNVDWLEVCVQELGADHTPDWFRNHGWWVHEREYGTRVFGSMFTLMDAAGLPFIEVRRAPLTPVLPAGFSHLRFVNRACYLPDAVALMRDFIDRYDYSFVRISRIDICLDLVRFDDNTIPRVFMQRYMRGKFSKINQSNVRAHGTDNWTGRVWSSVSWGSPSSMVSTKFYNKTLELHDPRSDSYGKPWIRYAWLLAGFIDDMDRVSLKGVTQEVWRIEFSIKSSVKRWFVIERDGKAKSYQSVHNTLDMYDSTDKLLTMFASLSRHYFRFKRYIMGQRKDRCPDRLLFRWNDVQDVVQIDRSDVTPARVPSSQLLMTIKQLRNFQQSVSDKTLLSLLQQILQILETMQLQQETPSGISKQELTALQLQLKRAIHGNHQRLSVLLKEVSQLLQLNEHTAPFL